MTEPKLMHDEELVIKCLRDHLQEYFCNMYEGINIEEMSIRIIERVRDNFTLDNMHSDLLTERVRSQNDRSENRRNK